MFGPIFTGDSWQYLTKMANTLKRKNSIIDEARRSFLKGALLAASSAALATCFPLKVFAAPSSQKESALYSPRGLALATDGKLYVADAGNYCVRIFDSEGRLVGSLGGPGDGIGEFNYPTDLFVDGDQLAVVDTNNGRICFYNRHNGNFIKTLGSLGGSADRLFSPSGIAIRANRMYVANTRSNCCQIWNLDDGKIVGVIGILGDEASLPKAKDRDIRFRLPTAIEISPNGKTIFIADSKHGRVVICDDSGGFIAQIDAAETGTLLQRPQDICYSEGELFICDTGNKRVVRINSETGKVRVLEGNWNEPVGIDVMNGLLAVSDDHADPAKSRVMTVKIPS